MSEPARPQLFSEVLEVSLKYVGFEGKCCSNGCKPYSADLDEFFSIHPIHIETIKYTLSSQNANRSKRCSTSGLRVCVCSYILLVPMNNNTPTT